jgi:hypothetical protein
MTNLQMLETQRQLILLAETGVLIHDLGKFSTTFVRQPGAHWHSQILHRLIDEQTVYFASSRKVRTHVLDWIEEDLSQIEEKDTRDALQSLVDQARTRQDHVIDLARWFIETAEPKISDTLASLLRNKYWSVALQEGFVNEAEVELVPLKLRDLLNSQEFSSDLRVPIFGAQQLTIGDFIALHHDTYVVSLPQLVQLLQARRGGTDGFDSWIDKQIACVKQAPDQTYIATAFGYEPESGRIVLEELDDLRLRYATALTQALQEIWEADDALDAEAWYALLCGSRRGLRARTEMAFRHALGETRRTANDVTLWDHCYATASLYKASLAKVLLEGQWAEPKRIGWRFLHIGVDGLEFWGQAHHVTDMLGRRAALTEALDRVRRALEVTYPVGNEIYRDENGSVFVMPALNGEAKGRSLHEAFAQVVASKVRTAFQRLTQSELGIAGELVPALSWNPEGAVRKGKYEDRGKTKDDGYPSMIDAFGALVGQSPTPATTHPAVMNAWWSGAPTSRREICTVCGLRPVGYRPPDVSMETWVTPSKAIPRHVCCVCLERRGRRAQVWLTQHPHRTIWADEVADVNGRFALLVGRFDLSQWLDGTLVRTMDIAVPDPGERKDCQQVGKSTSKNPSPARVRRVWETTCRFWTEIQDRAIPDLLAPHRPRVVMVPRNPSELDSALGGYHTYELSIGGQIIGVVWDPQAKVLIPTEYLRDLARRLALRGEPWKQRRLETGPLESMEVVEARARRALCDWLAEHQTEAGWPLLEPSGYGSPAQAKEGIRVALAETRCGTLEAYIPHIPLLTEPALFMALVPADRAVDVIEAIRHKYEREMHKVLDRLPLHLGMVIAPRRTPLRAVLDAGRAMLQRAGPRWEPWEVVEKPAKKEADEAPAYVCEGNRHFMRWWDVSLQAKHSKTPPVSDAEAPLDSAGEGATAPGTERRNLRIGAVMGDGETPDVWYPHLLTRAPEVGDGLDDRPWKHPADLEPGDVVYIAASTFDFEFLDTTARRFEIAYGAAGRRRGWPTRPYRLDEVERLHAVWRLVAGRLTNSQWMALDSLIEAKRQAWGESRGVAEDYTPAFQRFVRDALRTAEWRWAVVTQGEGATGKAHHEQRRGWRNLSATEQALLERAALQGVLHDVINLYHEAMKCEEAQS